MTESPTLQPERVKVEPVRGPYPKLMQTYEQITAWMKAEGMLGTDADWAKYMPMWEEYLHDPQSTPEDDLVTHICVPLH